MKIAELEIGKKYVVPLVVLSATARETKTKKQYLALDLFDGTDKISGNYWDWAGKAIPEKNAILNVSAQVTEWQGVKQLNISGLSTNADRHLSEFMPSSGYDLPELYKDAYSFLAGTIHDTEIRSQCLDVLEQYIERWLSAPAAVGVHHAYTAGTLIHSLSVSKIAYAVASTIPEANVDLAVAGGFLHDIGKLFGYTINGIVCELTDEGKLYDHLFIGANLINLQGYKGALLRHIILSHHGKLEHGAAVPPSCLEAHIVHHADTIDVAAEIIRDASKKGGQWTDRLWALENRPHLTPDFIRGVLVDPEAAALN